VIYPGRLLESVLKIDMDKKSGQAAELNSDHGDINAGFSARDRAFIKLRPGTNPITLSGTDSASPL